MTENNVYLIHDQNMEAFVTKMEKLNKKAIKLQFPLISYNVLEVIIKVDEKTKNVDRYHNIELNGEAPKLNGWKFVARLETIKGNKDNLVYVAPNENIPTIYRESGSVCEHCNSKRYRKYTYVLKHESGEFKQVGSSCLKDFLGHTDPQNYAKYLEWMEELSVLASEGETIERGNLSIKDYKYELDYFVAYVAEYIKETGYFISKSNAEMQDRQSTSDSVWNEMLNTQLKTDQKVVKSISDDSIKLANEAIQWAISLGENKNINDYQHNLYLSCSANVVDWRSKGIVASLITAYQYETDKIKKKEKIEKENENSQYFGEVGKREIFTLTVTKKRDVVSQFGVSTLHLFKDENGNIATWFSSNKEFDEGERVTIKATVKEHKEYNGMKQTILTRCIEVKTKEKKAS
jgi:hypothetical protein